MAVTLQMSKTGIYFRVFKRLKKGVHMCSVAIPAGSSHENNTLLTNTRTSFLTLHPGHWISRVKI